MATAFPLFDPEPSADGPDADGLWSVSGLTARVREAIEGRFGSVGLRGEVSNLARPRSGHVYLTIKDDYAQIRAMIWKDDARKLVFDLENGLAVRAWGGLTVYEPRGDYQIIVRRLEPEGVGALELAFRQTVLRLEAEGLFDPTRKRPIPRYPSRIVVVSSPTGAAVRDFIQVATRRWPAIEILVVPSRVQGEGASAEVAAAIGLADRVKEADLIVVARGGGSLEDLWAFNEVAVARAIFRARLPVVSAVGHEVDTTIADLVADLRAPTPSAAGELCVPDASEVRRELDGLRGRLDGLLAGRLRSARSVLDSLEARARYSTRSGLDRRRLALERLGGRLDALSPLGVLDRGYSLTQNAVDGAVVRSASTLNPGDRLRIRLANGSVLARVESVEPVPVPVPS